MKFPLAYSIPFKSESDRKIAQMIYKSFYEKARYEVTVYEIAEEETCKVTFENGNFDCVTMYTNASSDIVDVIDLIENFGGKVVLNEIHRVEVEIKNLLHAK